MKTTDETRDTLEPTFVIDFLQTITQTEITNPVSRHGKQLLISLSDHTMVCVTAPQVARDSQPPKQTEARIHNIATLRYVLEHDYGYGEDLKELRKIELHNFEECQTYLEDAVASQLNATYTNGLIDFMDGTKFLLSIELKH